MADKSKLVIDECALQFQNLSPVFEALRKEVQYTLEKGIEDRALKVHSCISRVKDVESFKEKSTRKNYAKPLVDMQDIVGARIVCLFPEDVSKVESLIRDSFRVVRYEDKETGGPPELWRYVSVHLDCEIAPTNCGARYDHIKDRLFEIQVRTVLQDAWATVEHYLAYKGERSIPDELRRDFSALAGLFHIADKSFQSIYNESKRSDARAEVAVKNIVAFRGRKETSQSAATHVNTACVEPDAGPDAVIDRSTLKALLRQLYADRPPSLNIQYSEFVEELADFGITSINDLRRYLADAQSAVLESEQQRNSGRRGNHRRRYTDLAFAIASISHVLPEFNEIQENKRGDRDESGET